MTMNPSRSRTIDWMASPISILGIPFDANSSYMQGAALAPAYIREALHCASANLCTENGLDLGQESRWQEDGDLTLSENAPASQAAFAQIEQAVAERLATGQRVISLGGDHSIAYPILRAYAKQFPSLSILQLDAHPDTYNIYEGNRYSHACPFARIMEEKLAQRLVQVGIRTMTPHQREQTARFGIQVIAMRHWTQALQLSFETPLYLSLDMDALDPAFAPGVAHHEPGGLSTRQVLDVIQNLQAHIVGADIVEVNPQRDAAGITAMAAAKLLKEILARMLE